MQIFLLPTIPVIVKADFNFLILNKTPGFLFDF